MIRESINTIMRDVVRVASARYVQEDGGRGISYLFGDWAYIADTLTAWGKSEATYTQKFPCIALYSPFVEQRGGDKQQRDQRTAELQMLILTHTRPEYDNETRERVSFKAVLRPIYEHLMEAIGRDLRIIKPYRGEVAHRYSENYRYGRSGVLSGDGKTFFDYIDAIELTQMQLTFKDSCNKPH